MPTTKSTAFSVVLQKLVARSVDNQVLVKRSELGFAIWVTSSRDTIVDIAETPCSFLLYYRRALSVELMVKFRVPIFYGADTVI